MKPSIKTGFSFGLTSGIITTLGLIVGLNASTHSKLVVIGGILTIAIADAFSDSLGIHVSEESEHKNRSKQIWEATASTFVSKFIFALSFVIPVILFNLSTAVIVSIIWGMAILGIYSFNIAKKTKRYRAIIEHLTIAGIVIIATHFAGKYIAVLFG